MFIHATSMLRKKNVAKLPQHNDKYVVVSLDKTPDNIFVYGSQTI